MATKIEKPNRCNQQQTKHLRQRLNSLYFGRVKPNQKMPADVKAAQEKVEAWNKKKYQDNDAHEVVFDDLKAKAEQSVLFGTPDEAVAAVEQFEAYCKKLSAG